MRRSFLLAVVVCLCCLASMVGSVSPAQAQGLAPQVKAQLTRELTAMVGDKGTQVPGLGVIIYKDGQEVYSKFLGHSHVAGQGLPAVAMTHDSRYRIASISKMFTAFTIMQLAEAGKLNLDDDVSKYLGFSLRNPASPDVPITIRMLLSHTSSLRDGKRYVTDPCDGLIESFSPSGKYYEAGVHFAPPQETVGKFFHYSNLNYGVLGTVIERVTGERFDKYLRSHILKQLEMEADFLPCNLSPAALAQVGVTYCKKDTQGHWDAEGPWYPQTQDYRNLTPQVDTVRHFYSDCSGVFAYYDFTNYLPGTNAIAFGPQGNLLVTLPELSHALLFLMEKGSYKGKQIITPASYQQLIAKQWVYDDAKPNGDTYDGALLSYGLGVFHIQGNGKNRVCKDKVVDLIGHTGECYGLTAGLFFRPGTRDGFVYFTTGEAYEEDEDPRSAGRFSGNYIWEEMVMDAVCRAMVAD